MRTLLVRQGATKSRPRTLPRSGSGPAGVRSVATNNPSLSAKQCAVSQFSADFDVAAPEMPAFAGISVLGSAGSEPGGPKFMRIFGFVSEGEIAGSLCPGPVHFDGDGRQRNPCRIRVAKG